MKKLGLFLLLSFIFVGCASTDNAYTESMIGKPLHIKSGVIISIQDIQIKSSGENRAIGAMSGAMVGSVVGGGSAHILAIPVGMILGSIIAGDLSRTNAKRIVVRLHNGEVIATALKSTKKINAFHVGDSVNIFYAGNNIYTIDPMK